MLKQDFVPVAIDQWYQRKQQDAEGEFYRKIASQGPRSDFNQTTQGRYICTADGKLLGFNNHRGPERIRNLMVQALESFDSATVTAEPIEEQSLDPKYVRNPPSGGLMLRVYTKVLGGYEPANDWRTAFQEAIGRDNAWFTKEEKSQLIRSIKSGGELPRVFAERLARFHLNDNTRGEPDRWTRDDIKQLNLTCDTNGVITGQVHLEKSNGQMGFVASVYGIATVSENEITQLDLVAKGDFWGQGRYTHGAPAGKFPVAFAFELADKTDPADLVVPFGGKGWLPGYYE